MSGREEHPAHIVVVGAGAGGLNLATRLSRRLRRSGKAEITLVDENLTHMWKPSLHEFAAGTKGTDEEISLLEHSNRNRYNFRLGRFSGIDRKNRHVLLDPVNDPQNRPLAPHRAVPYDILVLAIGSRSNDFGTPGVSEHCLFLDTPVQAKRLQSEILNLCLRLETGALANHSEHLNISIIGGGATGVELAAELREATEQFAQHGIDKLRDPRIVRIRVVEAAPRLVAALPEKISEKVAAKLNDLCVDLHTSSRVKRVDESSVVLADETKLDTDLAIWAAGIKAPQAIDALEGLEKGSLGRLKVLPTLQTTEDEAVYAFGDCADCVWPEKGTSLPPRAQVTSQQAEFLEHQLARHLSGRNLENFKYVDRGSLVALSRSAAVGAIMGKALGTMTIEGWLARRAYRYLHFLHEQSVQGRFRAVLRIMLGSAMKRVRPQLKLH